MSENNVESGQNPLDTLAGQYALLSSMLEEFIGKHCHSSESYEPVVLDIKSLHESCPPISENALQIAERYVSTDARERLGQILPNLLSSLKQEIVETPEILIDEEENSVPIEMWILFVLGLAIMNDEPCDFMDSLLDVLEEAGGDLSGISTNYVSGTIYESLAFARLLYSEDVPDWMRLNILLNSWEHNVAPEDRGIIADELADPDSFVSRNLPRICYDMAKNPRKYCAGLIQAVKGFLLGDFEEISPYFVGADLEYIRSCRETISWCLDDCLKELQKQPQ